MSTYPSDNTSVPADYFDGRSTKAHKVILSATDGSLLVRGDGIEREYAFSAIEISEPMQHAQRLLAFADGSHCQVLDDDNLAGLLAAEGIRDGWVVRLQKHWRSAFASIVVAFAGLFAAYTWGLPLLSQWIAYQVPATVIARIADGSLEFLDRAIFAPTALPQYRQAALTDAFARLLVPDSDKPAYELQFRSSELIGANAFALIDGTLVVTDELVELAENDEELLAVLAHELGHLDQRHSLRMLIQSSIVAFTVSVYLGDVSSIAAGVPTLLLQARYSRGHETEADSYAAAMLEFNGISPGRLADMLRKLELARRERIMVEPPDASESDRSSSVRPADYLSSHPATQERIDALNNRAQ